MPDISKIKLILDQDEEETYEVKDNEARNILATLLGQKEEESSKE